MGAWTDVYAICAVIYTALSGKTPMDAIARLQGKELVPLSEYGVELSGWQWNAIEKGMNMRSARRFRNVGALLDALTIPPATEDLPTIREPEVESDIQEKIGHLKSQGVNDRKKVFAVLTGAVALLCVIVGLAWYEGKQGAQRDFAVATEQGANVETDEAAAKDAGQEANGEGDGTAAKDAGQEANGEGDGAAAKDPGQGANGETDETAASEQEKTDDPTTTEEQIKLCTMPNVLGMTETAATTKIAREDGTITISVTKSYSDDVEAGLVMEQNVEPDTRYNEGAISEIVLVISEGPKPVSQKSTAASSTSSSKSSNKKKTDTKTNGNEAVDFFLDD
jgi:hypothetical protein